jgi:hypothetical protein
MNKIVIKVASRGLYVLHYFGSAIIAVILTIFTFKFIGDLNQLIFIVIFGGVWYLISRFTKNIAKGQVALEIKQDGIQVDWTKQIMLHDKKDLLIKWKEISDYMFQPEQHFNLLRIRTKDKRTFNFNMLDENDDFPLFYEKLQEEIKTKAESIHIQRAKNIYETKYGLISAIFIGVVIVMGLIAFLVIEPKGNSKPNYGLLIASLAGGIFFIIQVLNYRKKSKNVG